MDNASCDNFCFAGTSAGNDLQVWPGVLNGGLLTGCELHRLLEMKGLGRESRSATKVLGYSGGQ